MMKSYRKKLKMYLATLMLVSSLELIVAQTANAYVAYKLLGNVPAHEQSMSKWCWAAVTEMIADRFGASATQPDIVEFVKGSIVNETANIYDMQSALSNYNVNSTVSLNSLSFSTIVSNIEGTQPIGTAITYNSGSGGHAHTIYGYYQNTDISKNDVYYIDPLDASKNIMSYNSYKSNSSWIWVNSLYNTYV